jgi:hypothetical protein
MSSNIEPMTVTLPDQKNYDVAYNLAFKLAGEKLNSPDKIMEQCRKSESTCEVSNSSTIINIRYLNRTYLVSFPEVAVTLSGSEEKVELRDKILILDYLNRAAGTPISGKLIAYKELKEGANYFPSFYSRAIKPLIDYFGPNPDKLPALAKELGGYRANYGDVSVTIPAFARVPITLVVWRGDEEFAPNANILFDRTILDYLSAEDINVLCQTITWRLVGLLKSKPNAVLENR